MWDVPEPQMNTKDKIIYIMIAINGVILTGALFFILHFFVTQTVGEEKRQFVNQANKIISASMAEVEADMASVAPLMMMSKTSALDMDKVKSLVEDALFDDKEKMVLTSLHFITQSDGETHINTIHQYPAAKSKIDNTTLGNYFNVNREALDTKKTVSDLIEGKNYIFAQKIETEETKETKKSTSKKGGKKSH